MFVICFGDGLGNQMFQYAFYLSMKRKYPHNRVLGDICNFYGSCNSHNGFELNKVFGIKIEECSNKRAILLADYYPLNFKKHFFLNTIFALKCILFGKKDSFIIEDDASEFYEEVYHLNPLKSYMLRGNWINERYFYDIKQQLIDNFRFPPIDDVVNLKHYEKIINSLSVSIHIRRGDYLSSGLCVDDEYYFRAMEYIECKLQKRICYFVFSDDIEYCKKILKNKSNVVYIDNNRNSKSFIDMQLMSMCKHNIITNSTFSFWGAYLNTNHSKIVIAPKSGVGTLNNAFICSNWIAI